MHLRPTPVLTSSKMPLLQLLEILILRSFPFFSPIRPYHSLPSLPLAFVFRFSFSVRPAHTMTSRNSLPSYPPAYVPRSYPLLGLPLLFQLAPGYGDLPHSPMSPEQASGPQFSGPSLVWVRLHVPSTKPWQVLAQWFATKIKQTKGTNSINWHLVRAYSVCVRHCPKFFTGRTHSLLPTSL